MVDFANNANRQFTVLGAAQSAKNETILALLNWVVAEDPILRRTRADQTNARLISIRMRFWVDLSGLHFCLPLTFTRA